MKIYLIIYPHCYTYINEKTIFVYNPQNKEYAYLDSTSQKHNISRDNISLRLDNITNKNTLTFSNQCIEKDLGYLYNTTSEISPINKTYNIRIVSSINKTKRALGYNNGFTILNHITSIHIYTTNNFLHLSHNDLYQQVCYPNTNKNSIVSLADISRFMYPNLNEVVISGDFNYSLIKNFANCYSDCSIIIRTVICEYDIPNVKKLANICKNVYFEFLITSTDEVLLAERCFYDMPENILLSLLIKNIQEINELKSEILPSHYVPLLCANNSNDLINEMLITQIEILHSNTSLDNIHKREFIHPNYYGHIFILQNGDITIANNYISNILKDSVLLELTNWINKADNPWFLTRNKSKICIDCPLSALCPPISIYEQLGHITKVCKGDICL